MTSTMRLPGVVGTHPVPSATGERATDLLWLAARWLSAEAASVAQPRNADLVRIAGECATTYEAALSAATPQDVRLAWEHAVVRQARNQVGSVPWSAASRVSELLRFEDKAAQGVTAT